MARPVKIGLDYFPLNTNIDADDKMELIESEFGSKGFAVVIKLFCKIYSDKGYYYDWTEKEKLLFAKRTGESVGLVDEIVKRSVKWGLFNESVFNQFHILTSAGIQSRFLEAVSRRKRIEMFKEILLINVSEHENGINVNINSINDDNSTQSKVKESKLKESIGAESPYGETFVPEEPVKKLPKQESGKAPQQSGVDRIDFDKLLKTINNVTGRGFQVINENTRKKFRTRLKDGYKKETILIAIKNAAKSEYHQGNGCQYLTPEFFSRADTLDKYGNDASAGKIPELVKNKIEQQNIPGPWHS